MRLNCRECRLGCDPQPLHAMCVLPDQLLGRVSGQARRDLILRLHHEGTIILLDQNGRPTTPTWFDCYHDNDFYISPVQAAALVAAIEAEELRLAEQERAEQVLREERQKAEQQRKRVEASERRRQWIAEAKAAGRWEHPVYKTLKDARAAGFHEREADEYGGEEIELKGHTLVRNCNKALSEGFRYAGPDDYDGEVMELNGHTFMRGGKTAVSRTEWKRRGFNVKLGQEPHATLSGRYSSWFVYRDDQVEPQQGRECPEHNSRPELAVAL